MIKFGETPPPYQFMPGDGYLTIRLSGALESPTVKGFQIATLEFLKEPYPFIVINCETVSSFSKDWLRELLRVQAELKVYNKAMRLIQVKQPLHDTLKREGVDTAFKFAPNLREALVEFGLVTKKALNTDFINPFLDATLHVLKVQANVLAKPGKIQLKTTEDPLSGDVSGVIGIVSETFNGSVVISFPEETFVKVMSNMLGETYTSLNKEIIDGAGEITNMIFGQAKIVLNDKGYGIKTAIPSVVSGKNHTLQALTKGPVVLVPFSSNAGDFFVEICLSG